MRENCNTSLRASVPLTSHTSPRGRIARIAHRPSPSRRMHWPMGDGVGHLASMCERHRTMGSFAAIVRWLCYMQPHLLPSCVLSMRMLRSGCTGPPDVTPLHNVQAPASYPSLPCATKACKSSVFLYCAIARCAAVSLRALDGAARLICSASGGVASLGDSRLLLTLHL